MSFVLLVRGVHIVAGGLALAAGVFALAAAKGRAGHVMAGRVFTVAGRVVVISALVGAASGVLDVDSRLGAMSAADLAVARDVVPVFFGVLGGLGLLASFDMERGIAALTGGRARRLWWIALANGIAGASLLGWGVVRLVDGRGGVSWFALVIGWFGVETFWSNVRPRRDAEPRLVGHAVGMVDAFFGFVAAFVLFGAGRALDLDFVGGDLRIVYVVALVVGSGQVVSRWWRRRLLADNDEAPGITEIPGASTASG